MEHKNKSLGDEDIVFMLLETLKSNGTFDEFRRQCVTDIDAKPTYRNWKQRIESYVNRFLSKVKYTPELNKNTVREQLRKHLLNGCDTQDLEEGADRILCQLFAAPQTLSIFKLKIENAVNEYLGIQNEAPPIELNGLKQSSTDLINVSNIEISTVFNPKIDSTPDTDDKACDKSQKDNIKDSRSDKKEKPSLCKEPKSLNGNRSDDENDAGGSSKEINCQYKNKTSTSDKTKSSSSNHKSSKKENSCKEVADKSKVVEKSKDIVEKSKEVVNTPKDAVKSNDLIDKSKDVINKPKDIISKPKDIVDKPRGIENNAKDVVENVKDIVEKSKEVINKPKDPIKKSNDLIEKSKDAVNKSNDLIDKSKDVINKPKDVANKPKDIVDRSKDKSYLSKNSSSSSHKSSRTDKKRTKRSLEEKKKSSSLCKEPKILNGNRSDDESNAGGSSKHKSKSSSSEKSKSSSSNHKNSRKGNSTDVVDKSKDKTVSKNSSNTNVVDETKDKSMSKNALSTDDTDKSKTKTLSTNSNITNIVEKSKTKSTLSKNSSCTDNVDKSKIKSSMSKNSSSTISIKKSNIKSSLIKNSNCTDFDDKCKEKSLSKISSNHKCNRTNTKRLKLSHTEKNQLPSKNVSVEEKKPEKPEWNDFRTSVITNDEQDAANVLLSMSAISYEGSHNEIITENIIFLENSSPTTQTLKTLTTEKAFDIKENSDQMKIFPTSDTDNVTENSQVKSSNLETSLSLKSVKNVGENSVTKFGHTFEKVCSVDIERLSSKDLELQCSSVKNNKITNEVQKPSEIEVDDSELNILDNEINLDISSENEKTNKIDSNEILKVPKLKLKLLPNQIDSLNKIKRTKHHTDKETKKLKPSTSCDISNEVSVSVINNVLINKNCEQIDQKSNNDMDVKNNDFALSDQVLQKETENNSSVGFIGFTDDEALPTNSHKKFKNFINTLTTKLNQKNLIVDGFKGFTSDEAIPCKNRDIVYRQIVKLQESESSKGFIGFSEEEAQKTTGHKYVEQHLELAKKQNNVDNQQQNVKSGGNGLQNGKTFNKVMAILYESNNDNDATPKEIYNQPNDINKKDNATVNNNNHNHDNWVVEQEMKYKLLPVKVKLERLMEYRCNNAKRVSESPQVPI